MRHGFGVYNILADFGQSRGANTATILPNDADHTRKYDRTILLRYNIMTNPGLFEDRKETFQTAVKAEYANDLTLKKSTAHQRAAIPDHATHANELLFGSWITQF